MSLCFSKCESIIQSMSKLREIKDKIEHYTQRAKRGWSDQDTWGGGEHILAVTSGVLRKLGDKKSHINWDLYFKMNYQTRGYNTLEEVAQDIDDFLAFEETSWIEDLDFELKHSTDNEGFLKSENTPYENRKIKEAMRKHKDEYDLRYRKMKNAMIFVAVNAPSLWD